jgi:2-methylisocitrate lyase-like PEP mutase family enzyme
MSTTTHRSSAGSRERLATDAALLRALHQIGDPLVLVNVWDAESARRVERSGGRAVATSSAAVAASLGLADGNAMPPAAAFDALGRIAAAVAVPVTADLESGYGLSADELVDRLLAAGGVGLNLEDSDHGRPGELIEAAAAAERLAAVRESATNSGVDVVVNARVDTYLHRGADPEQLLAETVRRARIYVDAGADCVYPIRLTDPLLIGQLTDELPGVAVNANIAPSTTVPTLAAARVSRISIGPQAHSLAMADLERRAALLIGGGILDA